VLVSDRLAALCVWLDGEGVFEFFHPRLQILDLRVLSSNYILICFPIMLVVTRAIGREAWTPVRNARIRTWSRPGRPGANSAGDVGAVAISLRVPHCVGDHCGKNR
jgi:hypothetical protein